MANNLVILESPGKISAVKNYLGSNYKVVASIGHVRDLPKSSLGIDIENNFEPHYINIWGKGDLVKELKKEAKNADKIFFATDPDREGEAISWHLAMILGDDAKKAKRVTFNEITKTAVKEAIKHPRNINMDLVNAQQARRILDRIVGYQISPILWKTIKSGLSAGRVQSVATKIIVEREEEIRKFVPSEYWTITATLKTSKNRNLVANFYGKSGKKLKISNKNQADKIVTDIENGEFYVKDIKKSEKIRSPQPPFITSTLQQEASKKYGFQSQKTMKIAQELYEGINLGSENGGVQGLITYMRTDSLRISNEAQLSAKDYILEKFGIDFYPNSPRIFKSKNTAQDAHEAIRPSKINMEPIKIKKYLTADQYKLYKLIWERFLASQMSNAKINTVVVDVANGDYLFKLNGQSVTFNGYLVIYEDSVDNHDIESEGDISFEKSSKLPSVYENEKLIFKAIDSSQHFTEPPARYDEAALIKFLEEKGIGRPSTYTPIITVIISRGYVAREGKFLVPTPLGEVTTKVMAEHFPDILNYQFTAKMEGDLDTIENGSITMQEVLKEFYSSFKVDLELAEKKLSSGEIEVPVEETDIVCEKCGSKMIIKNGRFGKFAACPNYPTCKNTKTLDKDGKELVSTISAPVENMKCDLCGSDMVIKVGKFGEFYACANYPKCKFTKAKDIKIDALCPDCGAEIISKMTKSKKQFYSCSNFPTCKFSTWDIPTSEKCPNCSSMLLEKKNKNYKYCRNEKCGYKTEE